MTTDAPAPVGGPRPQRPGPPPAAVRGKAVARASAYAGLLRIREPLPVWQSWLLGLLPVFVLLALWAAVTAGVAEERLISPTILPSPLEVVRSFPLLWFERALTRNLFVSFGRVVEGFALAAAFPAAGFLTWAVVNRGHKKSA